MEIIGGTRIFEDREGRPWWEVYSNLDAHHYPPEENKSFLRRALSASAATLPHKLYPVAGWNLLAYYAQPFETLTIDSAADKLFMDWAARWVLAAAGYYVPDPEEKPAANMRYEQDGKMMVVENAGPLARLAVRREAFAVEQPEGGVVEATAYMVEEFKVEAVSGCTLWYRSGGITCLKTWEDVDPIVIEPYFNVAANLLGLFELFPTGGKLEEKDRFLVFEAMDRILTAPDMFEPFHYRLPIHLAEADTPDGGYEGQIIVRIPCGPIARARYGTRIPTVKLELARASSNTRVCVRHL